METYIKLVIHFAKLFQKQRHNSLCSELLVHF